MSGFNVTDGQYWLAFALCDNNTSFTSTPDIITSLTGTGVKGQISRGMGLCPVEGVLAVNNTSGANKTYYVWAAKAIFNTPTALNWNNVMGNTNFERYFYAIKIN
jgi:hypothetical protein